ncbi:MAG: hypothetical protein KBC36_12430 [Spirochaetia bacterium]|nr:hypothetical protein [Spirochaetia bacterium]
MGGPLAPHVFLLRLKPLLASKSLAWDPRNRRKTREFMIEEGLFEDDAYEIIGRLGPEHYVWGPERDDNGTRGEVWRFSFPYTKQTPPRKPIRLYIKLKIWTDALGDAGIVMSFHDEGNYE